MTTDPTPDTDPIRKSSLPSIPPPEFEFFTWFPFPDDDGGDMVRGQRQRGVQVRRRVSYGDWEPVRPDRWAPEPPSEARPAAGVAPATDQTEPHSCGNCDGIDPDTCLLNRDRPAQPARGIRGLLEHVGMDLDGKDIHVAGRLVDAAPKADQAVADTEQAELGEQLDAAGETIAEKTVEIKRLGLMVDEYGRGASALTDKLKRVRDRHREACPFAKGEIPTGALYCGQCEALDAPAMPVPAAVPAGGQTTLRQRIAIAIADDDGHPWDTLCADTQQHYLDNADVVLAVLPDTSRAAAALWAADFAEEVAETLRKHHEFERSNGALDVMAELRRVAGGEQHTNSQTADEAHPPEHTWAAELYDPLADQWAPGTRHLVRERAVNALEHGRAIGPTWRDGTPTRRRLVRATTTYTVEAAHQPPAASAGPAAPDMEA